MKYQVSVNGQIEYIESKGNSFLDRKEIASFFISRLPCLAGMEKMGMYVPTTRKNVVSFSIEENPDKNFRDFARPEGTPSWKEPRATNADREFIFGDARIEMDWNACRLFGDEECAIPRTIHFFSTREISENVFPKW